MLTNETAIQRCLEIARNSLGKSRPNPMVGAVIVYNDHIIGEGYTSPYGGSHAEVNAVNSVKNKDLLAESTLYVTLEPCNHWGKTPPCTDLIIASKIPKVVIGCIDDNPEVAGTGIANLRSHGIEVVVGVLEEDCKEHHKRFLCFHKKQRPYIILKWAESLDGFLAPDTKPHKEPVWITNSYSRQLVHKWRSEEQAILVGTNTVIEDNPSLTVRDWFGESPIRVVLDRDLKLSPTYKVFNNHSTTLVITSNTHLGTSNVNFRYIDWQNPQNIAVQLCRILHEESITSIIIEGGAKTLQTFISENLWDEARIFIGSCQFNTGIAAPKIKGKLLTKTTLLNDALFIYNNDQSFDR